MMMLIMKLLFFLSNEIYKRGECVFLIKGTFLVSRVQNCHNLNVIYTLVKIISAGEVGPVVGVVLSRGKTFFFKR